LVKAEAGDEIWVATGTYYPTEGVDRSISFRLIEGVGVYGGFTGMEATRSQRDWQAHPTVLSGNIGDPALASDNSYHVVTAHEVDSSAILDGFTITEGRGHGVLPDDSGGGMVNDMASPTLANLVFEENSAAYRGGGMVNQASSNPSLINVRFTANSALIEGGGMVNTGGSAPNLYEVVFEDNTAAFGGGMFNEYAAPSLKRVRFEGNLASGSLAASGGGMYNTFSTPTMDEVYFGSNVADVDGGGLYNSYSDAVITQTAFVGNVSLNGGGVYNFASEPSFTNVTFSGNKAEYLGGGLCNQASSPILTHITMAANEAGYGGALHNHDISHPTMTNAILWGNAVWVDTYSSLTATYSLIEGGWPGEGNLNADPLLGDIADNGGFTPTHALLPGSPAIDANSQMTCALTDQRGLVRPLDGDANGETGCDMGAYEVHAIIFVDRDATGSGDGTTWADAFVDLKDALAYASAGSQIWVAEGTYFPTDTVDRSASFTLKNGVAVYGGFSGFETLRTERHLGTHLTTLSGNIGEQAEDADNSYHVVTASQVDHSAVLDGFIITGGSANGVDADGCGGGLFADSGSPALHNLTFFQNTALNGGGLCNTNQSSPTLVNVTFSANAAEKGGGMYSQASHPELHNVTFSGNISQDPAGLGGGLFNHESQPTLVNGILWNNTPNQISGPGAAVTFSIVEGGYAGEGNREDDPLLGPLAENGGPTLTHALMEGSPAIDSGSPEFCPGTDQRGVNRPVDGDRDGNARCDMGAFEFVPDLIRIYLPLVLR
jgi:hypothetical protein